MAAATISKAYSALPWYGCTIYVFEFTASEATDTIDVTDFGDSGTGISTIRGLLDFKAAGNLSAIADAATFSGTTVTVNDSLTRTLVVIGR